MAKKELRDSHIAGRFRDVVGKGVAEEMWADRLSDSSPLADLCYEPPE